MNDDASTTESGQSMSEDTAAQVAEPPMVDSSPGAADEGGNGEGGNGMLGPIELPSTSRLLVGLGGAVMALSTLFSWVKWGSDSFPNIAGVGLSTIGVGLAVFLVGLSLLLRPKSVGVTLGMALGAFAITLIFIVLNDGEALGFGAWLGLAGTAVAVLGTLQQVFESDDRPTLDLNHMSAALGAILAVVASFWLDWVLGFSQFPGGMGSEWLEGPINGIDTEVLFGLPILILAGIALVLVVEIVSVPSMALEGRQQALLLICRTAGVAITVIAGSNVLGMMMLGLFTFGSGPLVSLVGGIMLTRSVRQASNH